MNVGHKVAPLDSSKVYLLAADAILLLHVLLAAFVVLGLVFILVGKVRSWNWVRNPWFRLTHLFVIGAVVVQSWFGRICPLTAVEMALRSRGGDAVYSGSFISHWLNTVLYYDAPSWVFVIIYTTFAVVVALSWLWVPPHLFTRHANDNGC